MWLLAPLTSYGKIVVVGSQNVAPLDTIAVKRIYTGRVIEVNGVTVYPVNIKASHPNRERFLKKYLKQNSDEYEAYWTVRRFIGKGTPPIELNSEKEIIEYIRSNSGAIGYLNQDNMTLPKDLKILSD